MSRDRGLQFVQGHGLSRGLSLPQERITSSLQNDVPVAPVKEAASVSDSPAVAVVREGDFVVSPSQIFPSVSAVIESDSDVATVTATGPVTEGIDKDMLGGQDQDESYLQSSKPMYPIVLTPAGSPPLVHTSPNPLATAAVAPLSPGISTRVLPSPSTDPSHGPARDSSRSMSPADGHRTSKSVVSSTRPSSALSQGRLPHKTQISGTAIADESMNSRSSRQRFPRDHKASFDIPHANSSYPPDVPTFYQSWPGLRAFGKLGAGVVEGGGGGPCLTNSQIHSVLTQEIVHYMAAIDYATAARRLYVLALF